MCVWEIEWYAYTTLNWLFVGCSAGIFVRSVMQWFYEFMWILKKNAMSAFVGFVVVLMK